MLLVQVPRQQLYFLRNQDCSVQLPCLAFFESLKNHMHIHTHNLEVVCLLHNFRIPKRWHSRDWTTKTHNLKIVYMHMYVFLSPSQVCSKLHTTRSTGFLWIAAPCLAFFESLKNHMHIHTHNLEVVCLLHNFRIPKRWQSRDWSTKTHNLKIVHICTCMYFCLPVRSVVSCIH